MAQDQLKSTFIKDKEVKNIDIDTGAVDGRVIKNSAVSTIHLQNGSITIEKIQPELRERFLPNRDTFQALSNSVFPSADNPYVTRREAFSYRTTWKDPVESFDNLPLVSSRLNKENDTRLVADERRFYVWQNNAWFKIETSSSSTQSSTSETETSTAGTFRKNVSVFKYDFTLGQGEYFDLIHDSDIEFNRIIQIKERVIGSTPYSDAIEFSDEDDYVKTSFYTVSNTTLNISSRQVVGSNSVVWDPGVISLGAEDEEGNNYRIDMILTQDSNNLPYIINLESTLKTNYTGNFYLSNVVVNNNEAAIIRQRNVNSFDLLKNTSNQSQSASNVQVFGSNITGITYVISIREDGTMTLDYKPEGNKNDWASYEVNYKFGNVFFPVRAVKFHAAHMLTTPENSTLMTNTLNNLGGNDMFGMAFLEEGTNKPYFVSWSHNFGDPVFFEKIILDSTGENYSDIKLDIRECKYVSDTLTFTGTTFDKSSIQTVYALAITGSVIANDGLTNQIALWVHTNLGSDFQSNWGTSDISPVLSPLLYAEKPIVLLSPQYSTESINPSGSNYIWGSRYFSIWIVYKNRQNKDIHCMIIDNETWTSGADDYAFLAGPTAGEVSAGRKDGIFEGSKNGTPTLSAFGNGNGYDSQSIFDSTTIKFSCEGIDDFDAVIWEDYNEPGLLYQDANETVDADQDIHLRGTPIVMASNSMVNSDEKPYEILARYKTPDTNTSITEWANIQETGRFGRNLVLKVESRYTKNVDNKTYGAGFSNADNVHIFYTQFKSGSLKSPVHAHNRFGTWENESLIPGSVSYNHRIKNFSDPMEYLDYTGIIDFDFDFDEFGQIDFAAFHNSADENLRGLYFSNQEYQCKYAIWESNVGATKSGPGARAGFTKFHHNGYAYIQGGYGPNNSIDTSMWRLHVSSNTWELVSTDNAPPRAFHVSDVIKNVAFIGSLPIQSTYGYSDIVPTFAFDGSAGSDFTSDPEKYFWVSLSNFGADCGETSLDQSGDGVLDGTPVLTTYQSFFEFWDSISVNRAQRRTTDVEKLTNKVMTQEGYRDSIIGFEFYNLTSGARGTISDISTPITAPATIGCGGGAQVAIELANISGGTRSSNNQFLESDQIVISYPGRPQFDQVIMYGGGSHSASEEIGYPDDVDRSVTWPPDSISLGGDGNVGDDQVYRDARTIFIANIDERRGNNLDFTFIPTASNGTTNAPVPCISGDMIVTDYTKDSVGGISNFPNFVLLNRSNAYRFKNTYEQKTDIQGRPFTFLGRWFKLDPIKANNGEPIEGITAWQGTKITHYGGIKPAPKGHATNPYLDSSSMVYFGGYTKSDFDGYYSNSLLVINVHDVNLGWSLIENSGIEAPSSRCGNGIAVLNRQIEDPESAEAEATRVVIGLDDDSASYIEYIKQNDVEKEIWITCGNDKDITPQNYSNSNAKDDIWGARYVTQRRRINIGELGTPVDFKPGDQPHEAVVDLDLNSGLNAFVLPNGLRTSDNSLNSIGETFDIASSYLKNDRFNDLSINDSVNFDDYAIYNGTTTSAPNWIDQVMLEPNSLIDDEIGSDIRNLTDRDGIYFPSSGSPMGERRWTVLAKIYVTIPSGNGSGEYPLFVGVYNNGINSYVEYFIPNESYFAFNLAFIQFSGGQYDEDPTINSGKSWFDVGTGTLHLQIRSLTSQAFAGTFFPYISKIENVNFAEITGVNWTDYDTPVGVKPFKNTWGGLISDGLQSDNVIYFGGRTHQDTIVENVFSWNSPSTFIQNEKSNEYFLSQVDGSDNSKWISLKHGNIVKNPAICRLGDEVDYHVESGEYYSAWGVAMLTLNKTTESGPIKDRAAIYYMSFNIIPNIRGAGTTPEDNNHDNQGLGLITFEPINYPLDLHTGTSQEYILEGELNYKEGKIYINQYSVLADISDAIIQIVDINYHTYEGATKSYYDDDAFSGQTTRHIGDKVGGEYSTRIPSWVYTGNASIPAEGIAFIRDDRALALDFKSDIYDSSVNITITDGQILTGLDPVWIANNRFYSTQFNVAASSLVGRVLLIVGNDPSNAAARRYSRLGEGLYNPSYSGYYVITANDSDANGFYVNINAAGAYGTIIVGASATGIEAHVMTGTLRISDIMGSTGIIPNSTIAVPPWMINEMKNISDNPAFTATDLEDVIDTIESSSVTDTANEVRYFGKIIFKKTKEFPNSDPDIEYIQYFTMKNDNSTIDLTGGGEVILKYNGTTSIYNAISDIGHPVAANELELLYVNNITEDTSGGYLELTFDLARGDRLVPSTYATIHGFEMEVNLLSYNDASEGDVINLPTEVFDPTTYLQWQDNEIKVLFSFDEARTWKKYNEQTDLWVAVDPQNVIDEGMLFSDLFNIISWPWSGWNNFGRSEERNLPMPYRGFIEGSTDSIKMFVGVKTLEPATTPSINGITMNFYSGSYWEPKNYYQNGTLGNDSGFLQVKMTSPTLVRVVNNHGTDSSNKKLKATILLNKNI